MIIVLMVLTGGWQGVDLPAQIGPHALLIEGESVFFCLDAFLLGARVRVLDHR